MTRNVEIQHQSLSSGEKQLLILLTQTLLQEKQPFIYIADEPELSLHIEWQHKIISAIKELNPNVQIIAATHSNLSCPYGCSLSECLDENLTPINTTMPLNTSDIEFTASLIIAAELAIKPTVSFIIVKNTFADILISEIFTAVFLLLLCFVIYSPRLG